MPNKAIFIGLGGSGVKTAGHLKAELLFEAYQGNSVQFEQDCRFIFIDTDDAAVNDINKDYWERLGEDALIEPRERVDLGDVNPRAIYVNAKLDPNKEEHQHLLSWVDEEGSKQFQNQPLSQGAGANRQQGRIAVWQHRTDIRTKISSALTILQGMNHADIVRTRPAFYILSGTCGGTGSSSFLDVAYILDREYKLSMGEDAGDPVVRAVLFMPYWYIELFESMNASDITIKNYQCNAIAFFEEAQFFPYDRYVNNDGKKFMDIAVAQYDEYKALPGADLDWPVFNFAICIDSTTEYGSTVTDEEMYRNTAESLYHWHVSDVQGKVLTGIDDEKLTYPTTSKSGQVPAFVTMGYRALEFPENLMQDYLGSRFLYELFQYGLLGKSYVDALPNQDVRGEELGNTLRVGISRYLFSDNSEEGVPNLQNTRREMIDRYLASLTLSRFNKEGKDEIDDDKIGDSSRLEDFIQYSESIISNLKNELERDFTSADSSTGRDRLLRYMALGYRVGTEELTGSLERSIESAILRFSTNYTIEFVSRLGVDCRERVQTLTDERKQRQSRQSDLDAEIKAAKSECLEAKKRDKENALNALHAALREDIMLAGETDTIEQQIRILNDLSQGESGILDDYRHRLEALKRLVQERLEGKQESGETTGLADIYKVSLPERFVDTKEEVTTTYLPDVALFVAGGTWRTEHLFARLYRNLVEQVRQVGGGEEPMRYGEDYGRHAERRGLHRSLWQMLTSRETTGMDRGYEQDGETAFFQRFFGRQNPQEISTAVMQLENYARRYIQHLIETSDEIRTELTQSLIDRFNALSGQEKQRIGAKFSDKGTQTFCRMISRTGGEQPTTYNVYAGHNQALAEELGFEPESNQHQFVTENTPNRLLKIKVQTQHTLKAYPHYAVYSRIYNQMKQMREEEDQEKVFPHIHKDFNEHGVENGVKVALRPFHPPEERELLDLFTQTLLYREMLKVASDEREDLVNTIIHLDTRLKGEEETLSSPLIIEQEGTRKVALICSKVDRRNDKLLLERGNYNRVSSQVRSFQSIYDGFCNSDERPAIQDVLAQFDTHFRARCTSLWLDILPQAQGELDRKIQQGLAKESLQKFYTDLNNRLIRIVEVLEKQIEQAVGEPTTPIHEEEEEDEVDV